MHHYVCDGLFGNRRERTKDKPSTAYIDEAITYRTAPVSAFGRGNLSVSKRIIDIID
ncbi:MAG: hypothetical protein MUC83_13265 [Pirellula sp.]|nr:hypothetical protein [Pirellula sp.]